MIRPTLAAAITATLLPFACSVAQAKDLTQADLQFIERLHETRLAEVARHYAHPDCNTYAVNELFDMVKAGYGEGLGLAEVHVPGQAPTDTHAVVTLTATYGGEPMTIVLDSLNRHLDTRANMLGKRGYVWVAEFSR
jgi:hypothetical protein